MKPSDPKTFPGWEQLGDREIEEIPPGVLPSGYAAWRDEMIEEARRDGVKWLVLPRPNGGEERIDLRLH